MYSLRQPHPDLAPFVENYWAVLAPPDVGFDLTVDVFVDVQADLVFTFGAPYERSRRGIAALDPTPQAYREPNLDAQRLYPTYRPCSKRSGSPRSSTTRRTTACGRAELLDTVGALSELEGFRDADRYDA